MAIGKSGPSAKRPRTTAAPNEEQKRDGREGESSGPLSVTLADPDVLDCPICFEYLSFPVFQHVVRAPAPPPYSRTNVQIASSQLETFEKVVESARVACRNAPYGCKETFNYSKKVGHEKACTYVPCSCPRCDFVGDSKRLYDHFALKHEDSARKFNFDSVVFISLTSSERHVVLQERTEGELFILDRLIETLGSFFSVVCVAQPASENRFSYKLAAVVGDGNSVKVKTSVEMVSKWKAKPPSKMSLLVPSNLISTSLQHFLYLTISKKPAPAT